MFTPKYIHLTNFLSFQDQHFDFRAGEAILIQGKNLDDASQSRNGAGKSSLIEGVAVAFSGSPIRNVVAKDLIFNGEKEAELELLLENPTIKVNLRIWRKLYANTKSSECRIWVNDVEKTDLPDINEKNKFIFEILGISKEDFFNFYLITDENGFVPFLKASDTKKKEIINRFSGADKVDLAIPFIEEDSARKGSEIDSVSKEIERVQGQQTLLVEQIMAEEEKITPEKVSLEVESKKAEIDGHNQFINSLTDKVGEFLTKRSRLEFSLSSFVKTDFDTLLKEKQSEKLLLEKENETLKISLGECKNKFSSEIELIKRQEQELIAEKQQTRESINEYRQFIDDINNKVASSIECPSCGHKFTLKDKTFNVVEALEQLPEAQKELSDLETLFATYAIKENGIEEVKQNINKKVLAEQESVKKSMYENAVADTAVCKAILEISNQKKEEERKLKDIQQSIDDCNLELERLGGQIKLSETNIATLQKEIDLLQQVDRSKIESLEAKAVELIEKEEQLNEQLQTLVEEKKSIDAWAINFKNFKSHLANKSLQNICDFTNLYLQKMGSNISIEIEGYRLLSSKKLKEEITTIVKKDGFPIGSYGKFSKGEKARIDICNVIANQELINLNSPTGGVDLLFADEVLDSMDSEGLERTLNTCQYIGRCIMIVSQNEINIAGHTIVIEKKNKVSKILS